MLITEDNLSILKLHFYKNRFLHLILYESNESLNQEYLILSIFSWTVSWALLEFEFKFEIKFEVTMLTLETSLSTILTSSITSWHFGASTFSWTVFGSSPFELFELFEILSAYIFSILPFRFLIVSFKLSIVLWRLQITLDWSLSKPIRSCIVGILLLLSMLVLVLVLMLTEVLESKLISWVWDILLLDTCKNLNKLL